MRTYGYTLTEHDPDRAWIVRNTEHQTVDLEDGASFFAWAAERWPPERYTVELDPWQLNPSPSEGRNERSGRR